MLSTEDNKNVHADENIIPVVYSRLLAFLVAQLLRSAQIKLERFSGLVVGGFSCWYVLAVRGCG